MRYVNLLIYLRPSPIYAWAVKLFYASLHPAIQGRNVQCQGTTPFSARSS